MAVDKVLLAAPRLLRRGGDGHQGAAWMVRASSRRCTATRDRPQQSWSTASRPRVVFVDDIADVPAGRPIMLSAHGSAPRWCWSRASAASWSMRLPLGAKATRGEGGGRGVPDRLRRARGSRGGGRTMAVAAGRHPPGESVDEGRLLPPSTPRRPSRRHAQPPRLVGRRDRTAERFPRCGGRSQRPVLRHHEPPVALGEIAERCDAVIVIGSATPRTPGALERWRRVRAKRCTGSTAPMSSPTTCTACRVTAGASARGAGPERDRPLDPAQGSRRSASPTRRVLRRRASSGPAVAVDVARHLATGGFGPDRPGLTTRPRRQRRPRALQ